MNEKKMTVITNESGSTVAKQSPAPKTECNSTHASILTESEWILHHLRRASTCARLCQLIDVRDTCEYAIGFLRCIEIIGTTNQDVQRYLCGLIDVMMVDLNIARDLNSQLHNLIYTTRAEYHLATAWLLANGMGDQVGAELHNYPHGGA